MATLSVGVTRLTSGTIHASDVVKMSATVRAGGNTTAAGIYLSIGADRGATVTPNCTESAGRCIIGDLTGHSQSVAFTVSVPSGITGKVTISAASWARNVSQVGGGDSFTVAAPAKTTNTGNSTNTNTGTTNANNSTTPNTGTAPNANLTPNNNTTGQNPATTPVLPNVNSNPQTAAMNPAANKATMKAAPASADQLTFSRLASTQAAFLMALLVAFGLLMTQLRLGRAPARPTKPQGAHRRRPNLLRFRRR